MKPIKVPNLYAKIFDSSDRKPYRFATGIRPVLPALKSGAGMEIKLFNRWSIFTSKDHPFPGFHIRRTPDESLTLRVYGFI